MGKGLFCDSKEKRQISVTEKGIMLFLLLVLFGILLLSAGVKAYPDTESYMMMSPTREPLYPLFLNMMSVLFGKYRDIAIGIFQNALAVISVYLTAVFLGRRMKSRVVFYLTVVCMLLPYVITPLFAASGLILTNALLSEGLALSMYNLYFLFLVKVIWDENAKKNTILALLTALLLSLIRSQFLVTLIAWMIVMVCLQLKEKVSLKRIMFVLVLFCCAVGVRQLCMNSYNLLANGKFVGTTYGPVTVLSNVIYVSDKTDGDAIKDDVARTLFYEIYEEVKSENMLRVDAPEDFTGEASFFSHVHDEIKFSYIYPILEDYVESETPSIGYMDKLMRIDALASEMIKGALSSSLLSWLSHYFCNACVGFVRTVAYVHPVLNILTLLGYVILIGMGIYNYYLYKDSPAGRFFLLTALLTMGNVFAVAITIMCLSRYMIYNMSLIYISAVLLLWEIFQKKKGKEIEGAMRK